MRAKDALELREALTEELVRWLGMGSFSAARAFDWTRGLRRLARLSGIARATLHEDILGDARARLDEGES